MKKRVLVFIICIVLLISLLGGIAYASDLVSFSNWSLGEKYSVNYGEKEKTAYSLDTLLKMYKNSGAGYRKIQLQYELNDLYFLKLYDQQSSQDYSINQYRELINQNDIQIINYRNEMESFAMGSEEWNATKSKLDTCLMNSISYNSYLDNLLLQKADIYEQYENYKFISNNKEILLMQDYKKQIVEFEENCLYLIVLKENKNLADSSVEYSNLLYQINKTNLSQGRATKMDIDYQEAELLTAEGKRDSVLLCYNSLFKNIIRSVGINDNNSVEIQFDIETYRQQILIEYETAENSFIKNDIQKKQLDNNILIIDGKIDILSNVYGCEYPELDIEKKKKEIAELELDTYLLNRSILFNNLYSDYESKYDVVSIEEKKASAQNKKYTVALNKYNLGLISSIELQEAKLKLRQSELDAWTAFYDYVRAFNTIEIAMLGLI